jgi:hypothetical protein
VRPAVQSHKAVAVLFRKAGYIARRRDRLGVVDDEDDPLLARYQAEEISLEYGENDGRVVGQEFRVRAVGPCRAHGREIVAFHFFVAETDPARTVEEYDDIFVAEQDLGDVFLNFDEEEFSFIHFMGQKIADVAVDDIEVRRF